MAGGIAHSAGRVAARFRARAAAIEPELRQAATLGARRLETISRAVLTQEIYSVPVKMKAGGGPAWTRTGRLLMNERGSRDGLAVVLRNRTRYAAYRRDLGIRGKRRVRPPQRSVQWQQRAAEQGRPVLLQFRRQAVQSALLRK